MKIEKAKEFILKYARPIDRAVYGYYFEDGTKDAVINELKKYQNKDGGFGNALELDNWNPASNPIATNDAIITLERIGAIDSSKQIVKDIVKYLSSHDSFDEEKKKWLFAIDSTKAYPHAVWWEKDGDGINKFNPTVSLATFMVCFGENTDYYRDIIREAFASLGVEKTDADSLKCVILSYKLLRENSITDIVDMEAAKRSITAEIANTVSRETEKYCVEYVAVPSDFFINGERDFLSDELRKLIAIEKEILDRAQKEDGGFDITWQWYNGYTEFEIARTLWRGRLTIDKLLFALNY